MRFGIALILNDHNFIEGYVSLKSLLNNISVVPSKIFIYFHQLTNIEMDILNDVSSEIDITYIHDKRYINENSIKQISLKEIKNTCDRLIVIQSCAFVKNSLDDFIKNNKNAIGVLFKRNISGVIQPSKKEIDYGFCVCDVKNTNCEVLEELVLSKEQNMPLDIYYNLHPMVTIEELNGFQKKKYLSLREMKKRCCVEKLYSSIATRRRKKTIDYKMWMRYIQDDSVLYNLFLNKVNNNNETSSVKEKNRLLKKYIDYKGNVYFKVLGVNVLGKKILANRRIYTVFNMPVLKVVDTLLFKKSYLFGIQIRKKINFASIDALITERLTQIGRNIYMANDRLNRNYIQKDKKNCKNVTSRMIESSVQELLLYKRLKEIKDDKIKIEDEIRLK